MRRVTVACLSSLATVCAWASPLDLSPVCPPDEPGSSASRALSTPLDALRKQAESAMASDPDAAVALICATIRRVAREQGTDTVEYGWWVGALATPLVAFQNKLSESIPLLTTAQPILERHLGPNAPELADIHVAYAWIYFRQGRLADAGKEWERTIVIRELAPGDKKVELQKALVGLAQVKLAQRDFAAARANLDRAYAIVLENGDIVSEAAAAIESAYANLALREEDYTAMRRHAEETIRIERALSHAEAQLVPAHVMLGRALERLNEFDASERALIEAIRLAEGDDGPLQRHTLVALAELAAMLNARDEPARARPLALRAVALGDTTLGPTAPRMVRVLQTLAEAERALGNLPQALAAYERAGAIVTQSSGDVEKPMLVAYYSGRGDLEWTLGELDESRASFDRGLAAAGNDPTLAIERAGVLLGLAHTWARADPPTAHGYLEQALVLLEQRLPASHPTILRVVNEMCGIEARETPADAPSCDAAKERLEASRDIDPSLAAAVHANQSERAERRGDAEGARAKAILSLASAETLGTPAVLWSAYFRLARLLAPTTPNGDRTLAVFFGKLSVRQIERQRERLVGEYRRFDRPFLQDKVEVYRTLADWLMEDGRIDEGLEVLRLLKSEELWDFVARSVEDDRTVSLSPRETVLGQAYAAALRANAEIGERLERLARLGEAELLSAAEHSQLATLIEAHRDEARSRAQRIARLIASGAPAEQPASSRRAPGDGLLSAELGRYGADTAVAVYLLTPTHLRILIATANGQTEARVDLSRAALQRDIGNYLDAITRRVDVEHASRALYTTLAARVDAEATKAHAKRLVLWLDGALRYVPFAALTGPSGALIERYTIETYADTALRAKSTVPSRALRVRGLGVTRAVAGYSALPAVADELCYLVRGPIEGLDTRHGACADTERGDALIEGEGFVDAAFTEARLVEPLRRGADFSVLHLGTHFSLRPGNALRSFIVLGDGNKITLERIGTLDFRGIELVTLSACQTGLGGATNDDGRELEALSALVQRRGAKRVVASLWPVEDRSTAALMRTMYRTFAGQPLDAGAALRSAQLAVRANAATAHPYFWAGFVASGSG